MSDGSVNSGRQADELMWLDGTAQADLVRAGEVSAVELVQAAIDRIERLNPALNAVIIPLFEKALVQARSAEAPAGPFHGVPMLLKDAVCHTQGDPSYTAMRVLKDLNWTEQEDSYLAARLRSAGFVFCGKTNLPELATSTTTEPLAHGATHNPWDLSRSPGGSSGGSAAAVASGMVAIAHGNDMAGSIRVPASCCGLVGLKPTRARTSLGPDHGEYWGPTTHEHVLTRSVRDSAAVLDVTRGSAPGDPYTAPPPHRPYRHEVGTDPGALRVGFRTAIPNGTEDPHQDCADAVHATAELLESLGHHVGPAQAAALDDPAMLAATPIVFGAAIAWELERWSRRIGRQLDPADLEPMNGLLAETGRAVTAAQYLSAIHDWQRWGRGVAALWEREFDVLLTPTMPVLPPRIGELAPDSGDPADLIARLTGTLAFTLPFNVTGQPAISLPLHRNADGLPIGVQLVAAYGREDVLFRVASQLEQAAPWSDVRPSVPASASSLPIG